MIKKRFWKQCRFCGEPILQKARGRTRTTCSDACRSKLSRSRKGKGIRAFQQAEKRVKQRRAVPYNERSFDKNRFGPTLVLSKRESLYECMACGEPYKVDLWGRGERKGGPFCSNKCAELARYRWEIFKKAAYRADILHGGLQAQVKVRLHYGKLSPLCPHCNLPFAPNTTIYGTRKAGRPRKYCSDACRKAAYEHRWKMKKHGMARIHRYRLCAGCGIKFDRTDSLGRRNMRFHSEACQHRTNRRARQEHPGRVPQRKRMRTRSIWPSEQQARAHSVRVRIRVNVVGDSSGGTAGQQARGAASRGVVRESRAGSEKDRQGTEPAASTFRVA
jgi:hypothetical protein